MKKAIPLPKVEDAKVFWNKFSTFYAKMEKQITLIGRGLINMLDVEQANSILDCSCGTGINSVEIIKMKNDKTTLALSDLSSNMLNLAKFRINKFHDNPLRITDIQDYNPESFKANENVFDKFKLSFHEANNETLECFQDNQFDRILNSLSLNIVPDPKKVLTQFHRILKPNGKVGVSVWGDKEQCHMFTFMNPIFEKHGVKLPDGRSQFYLGDQQKFIKLFKDNGFENIQSWYTNIPMNLQRKFFESRIEKHNVSKEIEEAIMKDVDAYIENQQNNHKVFTFNALCVVAEKPNS